MRLGEFGQQAATLNSAPPEKKIGQMADLVTQLVEQRMTRDERKAKMEVTMTEHMQMGEESMAQCPMMKDMKDTDAKPG